MGYHSIYDVIAKYVSGIGNLELEWQLSVFAV
jgi:hypothetical protein